MLRNAHIVCSAMCLLAILSVLHHPAVAQGKNLTIELARLPEKHLSADGWSDKTVVDGKPCRIARSGRTALLKVKAWWSSDGLRPPRGSYWLARIRYKDLAIQPIRFLVWAGIGRYEGLTEMHRFGGFGDGKWKVAQVPLPWDMLMRRPGTQWTELAINSQAGDVPVEAIEIVPVSHDMLPSLAEQWNAETCDWVRRAQARHAGKPRKEFASPQEPVLSESQEREPIVPYVRSWMQIIYPYSAPQKGEAGRKIEVRMALNEYEPAAFAIYAPSTDLTGVKVSVEAPRHIEDPEVTIAVEVRTAEYCLVQNGSALAVFPQRLWPAFETQVRKGQSAWFWLTFRTDPTKSKPGLYRGRVIISANEGTASLPIEVTVLPIRLLEMNETDLFMGGCHPSLLPRHEMEELVRHNFNGMNIWFHSNFPNFIPKGKDDFDLDFAVLDDWAKQAGEVGIRGIVWFLGGNPYGFPMTMTLERELAKQVLGMTNEQFRSLIMRDPYNIPPEIVPLYKKWVRKVWEHATKNGWPEVILTPFDEPDKWRQRRQGTGPWIRPHFEQGCKLIHAAAPECKVYASIHHAPGIIFLPYIDIFCTNAIHEDPLLGDKVRAAGKIFWQYSGTSAAGLPDRGRFAFGFFFAAFDSRGSLVWAYNWYRGYDTTEGYNWGFAWTSPLDVIPAPYYEGLREAWDDRRYIETLKVLAKRSGSDISSFLADLFEQAKRLRGAGGRDTVSDFWVAAKRVEQIDQMRQRVIDKILEILSKHGSN